MAALVPLVLAAAGCTSGIHCATELPAEFEAPLVENVEEINLSRLPNLGGNSDRIDPGDVLDVTIVTNFGSLNATTTPVRVRQDGWANVPLVGSVDLAGLELLGAEQAIAAAAVHRQVFQQPHITVTMRRKRTNAVWVVGAVKEPSRYEIPQSSCSLFAALVAAGGLSEDADGEIEIRRPMFSNVAGSQQPGPSTIVGPDGYQSVQPSGAYAGQVTKVNLAEAVTQGGGGGYLEDGMVINVMKRAPKPIGVVGLVKHPAEIEMPPNQNMYLLDALAKAGGRTMQIADKVYIIRRIPERQQPVVISSSIKEAKLDAKANVRLAPGDIVSVEQTPVTVVFDALQNFLRFGATLPLF